MENLKKQSIAKDDFKLAGLDGLEIVDASGNVIGGYFGLPRHMIEKYKTILERDLPPGHTLRIASSKRSRARNTLTTCKLDGG